MKIHTTCQFSPTYVDYGYSKVGGIGLHFYCAVCGKWKGYLPDKEMMHKRKTGNRIQL